jgi:tRNA acetyltransferase TAN1
MLATLAAISVLTAADKFKNIIGMSVVGPDFDKLKRYNIEELRQGLSDNGTEVPTPAVSTEST